MVDFVSPLVSALVSNVVNKIGRRPEIIDFFKGNRVDEELLQNFKMLLVSAARVLSDAKEKQFIDPWVKEWLDNLKDATYDADVLDEYVTRLCHESRIDYQSLNPFKKHVQSKVRYLIERLKALVEHKNLLALKKGGGGKFLSFASPTTSLVDERQVYGRNADKEKIVDFLLSSNSNGDGMSVVAIVGMEGIGKTTVARIVYNDRRVRDSFDAVSWISVSEASDVVEITTKIIDSLSVLRLESTPSRPQSDIGET